MAWLPSPWSDYPDLEGLEQAWEALAREAGARRRLVGRSVEGRPLHVLELGHPAGTPVLLTGLMHGVEIVGALGLLDFVRSLADDPSSDLLRHARIAVMPIVNPDAFATNTERLAMGWRAFQRCNARGVDLNRNFPRLREDLPRNPLGGSRLRLSPHYLGPSPLSEPESRAVHALAEELRPKVSLAYHSFGEVLLYPWAYTSRPNPRRALYEGAGDAFLGGLRGPRYRVMQARSWYPIVGDLDDWLDAAFGTLAFTVEISRPMRERRNLRHFGNPFAWSNPVHVGGSVAGVAPAARALVDSALAA